LINLSIFTLTSSNRQVLKIPFFCSISFSIPLFPLFYFFRDWGCSLILITASRSAPAISISQYQAIGHRRIGRHGRIRRRCRRRRRRRRRIGCNMIIACAAGHSPTASIHVRFLAFVSSRSERRASRARVSMPELCLSYAPRSPGRPSRVGSEVGSPTPLPTPSPAALLALTLRPLDLLSRVVLSVRPSLSDVAASPSFGVGGMRAYANVGRSSETAAQQDLMTRDRFCSFARI